MSDSPERVAPPLSDAELAKRLRGSVPFLEWQCCGGDHGMTADLTAAADRIDALRSQIDAAQLVIERSSRFHRGLESNDNAADKESTK